MSTHSDCGEDILWLRRPDDPDRWMPPFEFAGYRYVTEGSGEQATAIQVPTYIVHHCSPEKVRAWNEYRKELEAATLEGNQIALEAKMSNYRVARERDRERAWDYALKFTCPVSKCSMPPGSKCIDLGKKKRGIDAETKNPHPERIDPDITTFEGSVFDKEHKP